jgi:hypothetical protein
MSALSRYLPAIFFVTLILWTIALLVPIPHESASQVLGDEANQYIFAKCLHASVYAYLTILTALMTVTRRQHWWLLGLMSLHACLTEALQTYVGRHGCFKDVGIDHLGIGAGVLISSLGYASGWWRPLRWREFRSTTAKEARVADILFVWLALVSLTLVWLAERANQL